MAPLSKATQVHRVSSPQDEVQVYHGETDPVWSYGAVPHGGYVLACLVEACVKSQASSSHPDPIYVTSFYLRTTSMRHLDVHIQKIRMGRDFTHLTAELVQEDAVKVTTHLVFGVLDPASTPAPERAFELVPPAPHARVTPFTAHPSTRPSVPQRPGINFTEYFTRIDDPSISERFARLARAGDGTGGFDRGDWYRLNDPADTLTPTTLAFFGDIFMNVFPPFPGGPMPATWHPTIVMNIEFKAPIPRDPAAHSLRTLGSFASSRFVNEPQGRHNVYIELWTAPADVADRSTPAASWREEQRCLLVAHQMALIFPIALNEKKRAADAKSKPKL